MPLRPLIILLALAAIAPARLRAVQDSAETQSRVPALERFHEPIFTLWHTAWPARDVALMKSLLPDIERGARDVAEARLPGILRDKEEAWKRGVARLDTSVATYARAVAAGDTAGLLRAGEDLHARYEALVRTIRPPLKELDAFHGVLYVIYHHHLPAGAMDSIAADMPELKARMAALNAARLPERQKARQEKFDAERARLSQAVDELAAAVPARDRTEAAVNRVHAAYLALERVFQ